MRTSRRSDSRGEMKGRVCRYCREEFQPSPYHPHQKVCSAPGCQRRRRADYHRQKLLEDREYREQVRDSQRHWRENNPEYSKTYRASRRGTSPTSDFRRRLTKVLSRLLSDAKNNVAIDVRHSIADVWLIFNQHDATEKNIFASSQAILLEGVKSVLVLPQR